MFCDHKVVYRPIANQVNNLLVASRLAIVQTFIL